MVKLKKSILLSTVIAFEFATYAYAASEPQPMNISSVEQQVVDASPLTEQIKMLESAIVPTSPEETIDLWAKAVKMRNGALQYALFTENDKLGLKHSMEHFHWVTGGSSPWVEGYKIVSLENNSGLEKKYQVDFDLVTSTGAYGVDQALLTVVKQGDQWFIESLGPASEKSVGIWNTPESINEQNIENFEVSKVYNSPLGYQIRLPEKDINQLKIEQSTCTNEEGNPPCIHFYYKDAVAKKDVLLATVIRLSKTQEKLPYYQEHPFIQKLSENKMGSFYAIYPSEHQYAGLEDSEQGKEWSRLLELLRERVGKSIPSL